MSINSISNKLKQTEQFFKNIYNSILSCIKIVIVSKFNNRLPKAKQTECIILGNGPSLKNTLTNDIAVLKKSSLFCVNNFATAQEFMELQPSYYVILDPGFFLHKHRTDVI